jgi:hypothetical protein
MIRITLAALAVVAAFAGPAAADTGKLERDMQRMEEIARGAAEQFIGTFQKMIEQVPQYGVPEFLDNGDIIIRRKRDDAPAPEHRAPPPRRHQEQEALTGGTADI